MKSVICTLVNLAGTWMTLSEVHALLGVHFATLLKDAYPSFYERVEGKPYELPKYQIEPDFRLDLLFAFLYEYLNVQE